MPYLNKTIISVRSVRLSLSRRTRTNVNERCCAFPNCWAVERPWQPGKDGELKSIIRPVEGWRRSTSPVTYLEELDPLQLIVSCFPPARLRGVRGRHKCSKTSFIHYELVLESEKKRSVRIFRDGWREGGGDTYLYFGFRKREEARKVLAGRSEGSVPSAAADRDVDLQVLLRQVERLVENLEELVEVLVGRQQQQHRHPLAQLALIRNLRVVDENFGYFVAGQSVPQDGLALEHYDRASLDVSRACGTNRVRVKPSACKARSSLLARSAPGLTHESSINHSRDPESGPQNSSFARNTFFLIINPAPLRSKTAVLNTGQQL